MATELADALRVSLRVVGLLDALSIRHFVGGSVASSLHGIPRATEDVDIVAAIAGKVVPAVFGALRDEFYVDADMMLESILHRTEFNLIHLATATKIDVFVPGPGPAFEQQMLRARAVRITENPPCDLVVASAEDTVAQKLARYRRGGHVSERQWLDVLGVLKVQGKRLDRSILRSAVSELGVADLLDSALEEAGLPPG